METKTVTKRQKKKRYCVCVCDSHCDKLRIADNNDQIIKTHVSKMIIVQRTTLVRVKSIKHVYNNKFLQL